MIDMLNTTAFTLSEGNAITWLQLIYALGFVTVAWFVSRLLAYLVVKKVLSKTRISQDSRAIIQRIIFIAMIVLVVLSVLTYLGIPLATFAFISGAVAIGFGFGALYSFTDSMALGFDFTPGNGGSVSVLSLKYSL